MQGQACTEFKDRRGLLDAARLRDLPSEPCLLPTRAALTWDFESHPSASSFANRSWKDSFQEVMQGLMSLCHL